MKIDFDYIRNVSDSLHKAYLDDGGFGAYDRGQLVHSVTFDPVTGKATVHVQWPAFRDLVSQKADKPAVFQVFNENESSSDWIHWNCFVDGVKIVAVMSKSDLLMELEQYVEKAHKMYHRYDIRSLLAMYQNRSGWNLGWGAEEVQTNG